MARLELLRASYRASMGMTEDPYMYIYMCAYIYIYMADHCGFWQTEGPVRVDGRFSSGSLARPGLSALCVMLVQAY